MQDAVRLILQQRLEAVCQRIEAAARRSGRSAAEVTLVAVTKAVPVPVAAVLPELGVNDLAENRPQQLWHKAAAIPQARWHLIGHLQRNKIDRTVPLTTLIHSVDSWRLLQALEQFGQQQSRSVPILLQFNCSREASKQGFDPQQAESLATQLPHFPHLHVQGLMTMAALTPDPQQTRPVFAQLRQLRDYLQQQLGYPLPHLSMGMSQDFEVAIEEGATLVRLGTILLGGLELTSSR
jgi:pyridoxal phosphate enzyme (YggS family)